MQNENATIVTLAVFPFENLSESKEMDIFCKSFCIELITELSQPRRPVHCAELMGNVLSAQGEPLLDEKAKKSYQGKILEIQQEMGWAEERNDFKRLKPSILAINTCWPADMSS